MLIRLLIGICLMLAMAVDCGARPLIIGSEQDFPPFAIGQTDTDADGFSVALWKEVAKEAGLDYSIRVRPWGQLLKEFKEGNIDVLINIAQSEERRAYTDFSVPHVIVKGAIFARANAPPIRSEADLANKSIIVFKSDTAHEYAISRGLANRLVLVDTPEEGFRLLAAGNHDVMLISKLAGLQILNSLKTTTIRALDVNVGFSQKFSFGVHKDQHELLARLNEALAVTKASGVYDALYQKWFGIYRLQEATFKDTLIYFAPVLVTGLGIGCYFLYQRHTERQQAAATLAASEEKLRLLLDSAGEGIYGIDLQGRCTFCNTACLKMLGYTHPAELLGKDMHQQIHHSNKNGSAFSVEECRIYQAFQRGEGAHVDDEVLWRSDGSCFAAEYWSYPQLKAGAVVGAVVTFIDITERIQAQKIIELDEARLESLLRISQYNFSTLQDLLDFALHEAILLTESRIGYLYYYDEQRQQFTLNSWSKEVMKECAIREYQTTYALDKTGFWGEAVRQRRPVIVNDFHADNPHKKGYPEGHAPLHSFMTIPVTIREEIVAVVGVANKESDYTDADVRQLTLMMDAVWKMAEHAKADQALLNAEMKYRNLLESIQLLAVMLDTDGNITFCNNYLLNLTGWTHDEIIGCNWFDLFIPHDEQATLKSVFMTNISNQPIQHFEHSILMRNGRQRLISWSNTTLFDPNGNITGIASIGIDLTDQRRTEEHLRQSLKMESVGRLAGGVAHDFNNMLSVILGYAEMSRLSLAEGDPMLDNLREITKAAERSRNITRQLLAFSRKELSSPKLLDLNSLISETGSALTRLIGEDIRLTIKPGANLWKIMIGPSQIDQILFNLAVNARDAMPAGGNLSIETSNAHLDETYCYKFLEARPGDYVQLTFSDNGSGMDSETLEHIFEPFYTTKDIGKGTGLGLATVYGIVTQHKGFIHVDSFPGTGTTFRIFFPRAAGETAQETKLETKNLNGSGTILIAEDEESVRRITATMLHHLGYNVLQAASPLTALALLESDEQRIDLLLTDVIMPEMSGKELYEIVKTMRPDIKVLFMSGYTADVIAQRAVLDDTVQFIQKPFEMVALSKKIKDVLNSNDTWQIKEEEDDYAHCTVQTG